MPSPVTTQDVRGAVRELGLSDTAVCVHSSLRSFGPVERGPDAIIDGLLAEGCTVLVPTFSGAMFSVHPPPDERPPRNGCDYGQMHTWPNNTDRVFTVDFDGMIADMGIIPRAVLERPERSRGYHPGSSFAAVGPLARVLTDPQQPLDVYAPLEALARHGGSVVLMGVGLNRMTLLHQAEKRAGRILARRWANGLDGGLLTVEAGGCSTGFPKLDESLAPLERRTRVGESLWRIFPAEDTLRIAADAIVADPSITHCGQDCVRCDDAVAGGPILD